MISKRLLRTLVNGNNMFAKMLTLKNGYRFINEMKYNEINEIFTDQEISMQNQFKDIEEETDSIHKGFNNKFFEFGDPSTQFSYKYQMNNSSKQRQQQSYEKSQRYEPRTNSTCLNKVMVRLHSTDCSESEKLDIVQHFFIQKRLREQEIDQSQQKYILQFIQPLISKINNDPSDYSTKTLLTLLNIARDDFLNIPLPLNTLLAIKKIILSTHQSFDFDLIKLAFFASCSRHTDSQVSVIDPHVSNAWLSRLVSGIQSASLMTPDLNDQNPSKTAQRNLVLFIAYLQKDSDLFRKSNRFLSHLLLSSSVLQKSNNSDLLKAVISIYTKYEKGSLPLFEHLLGVFINHISENRITLSQFQAILRSILRSHKFNNLPLLSSYSNQISPPKYDLSHVTKNINNEEEIQYQVAFEQRKGLEFEIIDKYVHSKMKELNCNQILNVLNLYQIKNAKNYKNTVEILLNNLIDIFHSQCDNFFSFSIIVRTLYLFEIEKPQKYLYFFNKWPEQLNSLNHHSNHIQNVLLIIELLFPESWNAHLIEKSNNFSNKSKNQKRFSSPSFSPLLKRSQMQMFQLILENMSIQFNSQHLINSIQVDFYVKASSMFPNSPSKIGQLPQIAFAIDLLSESDQVSPSILNGTLAIKSALLKQMKVPYVTFSQQFCNKLSKLNSPMQHKMIINHIQTELQYLK